MPLEAREGNVCRSNLWAHALVWAAFAVSVVLLHGAIWEENYEFAQVLLGRIPYPHAHPLYLHVKNLFSVQVYLTAAHLWLGGGPEGVNGLRNVLYVLAKTLPFFFVGAWLARRAWVGHLAALSALLFAGEGMTRAYPTLVWPMFAGNGVVGAGFALLALGCLACGRYLPGFALAAAMPAVHVGQCPPLGLLCALLFFHVHRKGTPQQRRDMLLGTAVGGLVTAASLLVYWQVRVEYAPAPPYLGVLDPQTVWERWLKYLGGHQALGIGKDLLVMLWALWVLLACLLAEKSRGGDARPYAVLFLYTLLLCGLVWPIMAIHAAWGSQTPHWLLAWMPYRLPNHLPPLLATVMAVRLCQGDFARGGMPAILLLFVLVIFGVEPETLFVALSGLALIPLAASLRPRVLGLAWFSVGLAVWWVLLAEFLLPRQVFLWGMGAGAAIVLLGGVPRPRVVENIHWGWRFASAGLLLLTLLLRPHVPPGNPDAVAFDTFERAVDRVKQRGELATGEMICVPHLQRTLQGRLSQPVTADFAMLTWVPYHPEIGPVIHVLFRDLYAFDFAPPFPEGEMDHWQDAWSRRSTKEWRRLGAQYGFTKVVVPQFMDLPLELVTEAGLFRLYTL